jgi:cobalamin biosynthesis Mg chelatase CobN
MGKKGMGWTGKTGKNALRRFIELTRPELAWTEQRRSERKDADSQAPAAQHGDSQASGGGAGAQNAGSQDADAQEADSQAAKTQPARGGPGSQRAGTQARRAPADKPQEGSRQERWRFIDISAMVIAVLQVILPITLILLAAVAGTYWLFILLFGG